MTQEERDIILALWARPAPLPFWQQIAEEVAEAPLHMQLGVALFFGAGIGMAIAIFAGWL